MTKLLSALLASLLLLVINEAHAAEIRVLTAGAMRAVVGALQPAFEKETGHTLSIDKDTAGGLAKRIGGGETFDVTIITPKVVDDLIKDGRITAGSRKDLAKVGMGVAVKEGAKAPDISTVEAFKSALLAAKSVAYIDPKAGGTSGIYFDKLLEKLGIAEQVRPKAKLLSGGYVADLVAKGEAEIAVHQISEIVPVKGVTLVGPLPKDVQNITVYAAGIAAAPKDMAAAIALMAFLAGSQAEAVLKVQGMEKP
jgi:molybdate transport system substrate-binding protein